MNQPHPASGPNDGPVTPCLVRFTAAEIQLGREHLHRQCVQFNDAAINRFMQQVFASDELVQAYLHPRLVKQGLLMGAGLGPHSGRLGEMPAEPTVLVPYEEARTAALQAQSMGILEGSEKRLAFLAAFLFPSGLFHSTHPAFALPRREFKPDSAYLRHLSHLLLEPGLRELGRSQPSMAETLEAVWGFGLGRRFAREGMARVATAANLAHLRVSGLWGVGDQDLPRAKG